MKILIIEDELPAVKRLKSLIEEAFSPPFEMINRDSISGSVEWLQNNPTPDLIFCDIQLADGISFEIFELVKVNVPVIFTTAYDQYAIRAFKLNSIDYLLKPIDSQEFKQSIEKFKNWSQDRALDINLLHSMLRGNKKAYKTRFLVKIGERIVSIKTDDITFFYSHEKNTYLQTIDKKKYIIDFSLDQIEEMLDPSIFFRLNRKYISSIEAISEIHAYFNSRLKVKLSCHDDNNILISREKVAAFKEWLGQ